MTFPTTVWMKQVTLQHQQRLASAAGDNHATCVHGSLSPSTSIHLHIFLVCPSLREGLSSLMAMVSMLPLFTFQLGNSIITLFYNMSFTTAFINIGSSYKHSMQATCMYHTLPRYYYRCCVCCECIRTTLL